MPNLRSSDPLGEAVPQRAEVLAAVERVASSATFQRSERLRKFLRFIVESTLDGRSEELKEYLIGVEVFGKGPSFDPRLDSAVRVEARRLRGKLEEYYQREGAGDAVRIRLPKGGYVPVFGWSTQFLPEPVDDYEVEDEEPPGVELSGPERRRLYLAGFSILTLAALGLWTWFGGGLLQEPSPARSHTVQSLAVLPFSNLTGRAENDRLCDGLTLELINRLARIQGLRVMSRTSTLAFRGSGIDVRKVARQLGVDSVIEGGIREDKSSVRISVQLVRGADGSHVWSESFDMPRGDDLGMQAHVARTVERKLASHLAPLVQFRPDLSDEEMRLNSLVMQANYLVQRRTADSLKRAIEYAEESVGARPGHAPGYAVLADAWFAMSGLLTGPDQEACIGKATESARKAIDLDPGLAGPLAVMGAIKLDYQWRWKEAEQFYREGLARNPDNPVVRARYARLLTLQGRHEEALREARAAEIIAPTSVMAVATLGQAMYYARRYEDAIRHLERALVIDPAFDNGRITVARAQGLMGRLDDAWLTTQKGSDQLRISPEMAALRTWLHGLSGRFEEARLHLPQARGATAVAMAGAYASLGDREAAFAVLRQALQEREPTLVYLQVTPVLDPLRGDPRLERLCAAVGLKHCGAR